MNVAAVMTQSVVTVDMDQTLEHVAALLEIHGFHHLLVLNQRKVVGIISDRDVLRSLSPFIGKAAERPQDVDTLKKKAHQLMTRALVSITAETTIEEAAGIMVANGVSCLPVLDAMGHARGIVSWRDLLKVLAATR